MRSLSTAAGLAIGLLAASACSTPPDLAASSDCAAFDEFGRFDGAEVHVLQSATAANGALMQQAWRQFSDCTNISVDLQSTESFEETIVDQTDEGTPPDLAIFPQPGLMSDLARRGALVPLPSPTITEAEAGWSSDWLKLGAVEGVNYAAPLSANVKSFVWYSPKLFDEQGWQVPATWGEMLALSEEMVSEGLTPWCVGFESGGATGWVGTDWLEDVILRTAGADTYDSWVAHDIPFDSAAIVEAADVAGDILRNPSFVNATGQGQDGVDSIAETSFDAAGLPILQQTCGLHRQASFYAAFWPEGTEVGPDGDVFAFYLPPMEAGGDRPVLVAGEIVAAFTDRPEVVALQTYLATQHFAERRIELGGWVSANRETDPALYNNPIDELSAQILADPRSLARFDGSDMMPGAVGTGSFWLGMTDWIRGQPTDETLARIERSWPAN